MMEFLNWLTESGWHFLAVVVLLMAFKPINVSIKKDSSDD